MAVFRIFTKIDAEGKITLPLNIQRGTGLKKDQLVELRVIGAGKKKTLVVSARDNAR